MLRAIKIDWKRPDDFLRLETPFPRPERTHPGLDEIDPETFPDFLDEIALVGMGGSGFRTSEKLRANRNSHTLVINGIECEPGISIDQSVLLNESPWVMAGAAACLKATGIQRIILALKKDPVTSSRLRKLYREVEIIEFPSRYPSGAEKLILKKLTGQLPPPGIRPYELGYLIQNVVTLRAIGRALQDGVPVVERPLTLAMPSVGFYKNIVVPVGFRIRELLATYSLPFDPFLHIIADSGLMMGREVAPEDRITKTSLSLLVLRRDEAWHEERPCTRCGACNTACPLDLHPFMLTEAIRKKKTGSPSFKAQMAECFLCGVCSAVCPSGIPLVQTLEKGKQCL